MTNQETHKNLPALDFELWLEAAQQGDDTFESMRLAAIEELIASAPEQARGRLRSLQWRIDQERHLSKSPMGACIRISQMMWETLTGENGLTDHLRDLTRSCEQGDYEAEPRSYQAQVIPFRPNC